MKTIIELSDQDIKDAVMAHIEAGVKVPHKTGRLHIESRVHGMNEDPVFQAWVEVELLTDQNRAKGAGEKENGA